MADAIRLYAEFTDDLGTDYRLNIHQNGWQVTEVEFNLGADGFTLRYSGDNENRMQPIIGSELTFTLIENNANHTLFLTDLATSEDADFTISIYKDPDGDNTLFFTGVLLAEQIALMDEAYPIQNTLNAVDELGNLANTLYNNDGTAYTGRDNIAQHLYKAIFKTRALHIYDNTDVLIRYANNFIPTTTFASVNALIESEVNHSAFYNQNAEGQPEFFPTFTVLENLAITFNARIFYADGCFNFIPVGAVIDDEELDLFTITKAGTVSGSSTAVSTELVVGTDIRKLRGGSQTFLPPLNDVRRSWITNANFPPLYESAQFLNPTGQQTAMGTTVSDSDLFYEDDSVLRLQFEFEYTYSGGGSFSGEDIPGRLVMRFTVKCGSLYYVNALSFGPTEITTGNFEASYNLDNMVFTAPAWSSSAGYFYVPMHTNFTYIDRNTGQIISNQMNQFGSNTLNVAAYNQPLAIDLDELTSQQTGLDITADLIGYDHDGTVITDITGSNAYGKLQNLSAFVMNGNATNGDEFIYSANTTNAGQLTFEQPAVQIGSTLFDTHKNIYDNNSTPGEIITEWSSLLYPSEDAAIHTLGVKEILAGQNNSTPIKRGGYYTGFVSPMNSLKFGADRYLPFECSFTARSVEGDYEAFELNIDNADVVTPEPEVIDTHDPQDDSEPVYDIRNLYAPDAGNLPPNIFKRLIQQPVTEVTNRAGTTYNITSTDAVLFNTWTGGNGTATINLPTTTGNEGRIIRFKSNDTIAANKNVTIRPDVAGETIDGATSYDFNRSYDGLSLLCYDGKWFIIQKKEKSSGGGSKTTTPTLASISDFESTSTATITVSNYDSSAEYRVLLYDNSNLEVSHTITDNSDGTFTIATGLSPATGYYVTVDAVGFGELLSDTATSNTFESQAAQTQMRYWRLQITDSTMTPVANKKIALGEFRLYTQTGASGTPYPSNMTSATTPSPYVVTRGYQFQNYHAYLAFDGSGSAAGSMWWTLGNHAATNAWIQIDLGSSIDLGSGECRITTSGGWTDAEYAVLYGSNTGSFSGEERRMAFFQNIKTAGQAGGTFSTFTQAIT